MIQAVAAAVQNKVHGKIAAVVTKCIAAVFQENISFEIRFEKKRGRTEARPVLIKDGHEMDPLDGSGGGVIDVASLALRVICLSMTRPAVRKLLVLDEPLKHLSANNHERARGLLLSLSEEFGMQVIMVTHNKNLVCGKIIEIE